MSGLPEFLVQNMTVRRSPFSELHRNSPGMLTATGVFTLIIMVVGVIGNLLTIVALLRNAKIRTFAAAFIASLCISDLFFCFLVLPFEASRFFHETWIHGEILCTMIPLLRYGCVGVSLLSVAQISINRYLLIAWPHLYSRIYTKATVVMYISFIWVFSYGIQIPILMGKWGVFALDEKLGTCSIMEDANGHSAKTFLFVIGFAIPCVMIVICYAKIYWVVRKSHNRLQQHNTGVKFRRSEMKITKMVLVIFVCFVVCYLPITIVKIFDNDAKYAPCHIIGYLLVYMSACVNPVVYVTMNKQYRQAYLDTLMCRLSSTLDSHQTQVPQSKAPMSVTFLKNVVNSNPKL